MNELINLIDEIVELCYQQKKTMALKKIDVFACEIAKVMVKFPDDRVLEVNSILKSILIAIEEDDIVSVADLLEYELKEKLV